MVNKIELILVKQSLLLSYKFIKINLTIWFDLLMCPLICFSFNCLVNGYL